MKKQLGVITASVAASNIQMSGSSARYKAGYQQAIRREISWDQVKANMDARMAEKAGQAAGSAAMYQGIGSAVSYGAQAYGAYSAGAASTDPGLGGDWAGNDPFKPAGG